MEAVPLIVNLDGGLLVSHPVLESVAALLGDKPELLLLVPVWLLRGRAHLTKQLSTRVSLNASLLPYHGQFWEWLKKERGRRSAIYMITSVDESNARALAEHLGVFDGFVPNYRQADQAEDARFGHESGIFDQVFDYAGSSRADLGAWSHCRNGIVIDASESVRRRAAATGRDMLVFAGESAGFHTYARALRLQQWPKNLLIFVPLITSHQLQNLRSVGAALLAAAAFSLCASSVYVVNDLADLAADRKHPTKRQRAFASGRLSLSAGAALWALTLGAAAALSIALPSSFRWVLCAYLILTCLYSVWLKRIVLIDVFVLAALYTSRLVAGSAAYSIELSYWLLSFSMFLFLSLGYCKRAVELLKMRSNRQHATPGDARLSCIGRRTSNHVRRCQWICLRAGSAALYTEQRRFDSVS